MEVSSLKKKFKDKKFAAGCSRDVIKQGAEQLGWTLEELMEKRFWLCVPAKTQSRWRWKPWCSPQADTCKLVAKKLLDRSTEEEYYPHKTVSKDRHADIGEYDYEEGSEIWRKLSGERKAV